MFNLKLDCNNKTYQSEGETILEALNNLPLNYVEVKTKGTITVTNGKQITSKFLTLKLLRKILSGKMMKTVWAQNIAYLLK